MLGAQPEDLPLRPAPEQRVLWLARHELLDAWKFERFLDLLGRPLAEAEVARLPLPHHLGERLHRLLERRVPVIAMTLVQIDVVGAQSSERRVDLLVDLLA